MVSQSRQTVEQPASATTCGVSACLLSWRRQHHLPEIVESLRPHVAEIIVWANEFPITEELPGVRVIHSPENQCTLGRFLAAREARFPICFTQDDDLCVRNIPALLEAYHRRPQIVANLADDRSSRHWTWWQVHRLPWVELGFGSVFPRDWAWRLADWPHEHALLQRKADKVFSVIHPWTAIRAGADEITRLFHEGRESGRDANALSLRADHKVLTDQAVALANQWASTLAPASQ